MWATPPRHRNFNTVVFDEIDRLRRLSAGGNRHNFASSW
jgi:hypothetical protein